MNDLPTRNAFKDNQTLSIMYLIEPADVRNGTAEIQRVN